MFAVRAISSPSCRVSRPEELNDGVRCAIRARNAADTLAPSARGREDVRAGSERFARRAGAGKLPSSNVIACQLYPLDVERNGQLSYYGSTAYRVPPTPLAIAIHGPPPRAARLVLLSFRSFSLASGSINSVSRIKRAARVSSQHDSRHPS